MTDARRQIGVSDNTCNAICPGYVNTPLVEAQIDGPFPASSFGAATEQTLRHRR